MTEELKQVSGETETPVETGAETKAMESPAAQTVESASVEGAAGSDFVVGQAVRVINAPPAGQTDTIQLAPGERFQLAANPASVNLVIDGNNLVLGFDLDGDGTPDSFVVLEDLVLMAGGANPPVLMVAGEPIGVDLLVGNAQALAQTDQGGPGTTLETAAGDAGAPGGGGAAYNDNLGDAIDLLVAQGVIPPVELEFGLIQLEGEVPIVEEEDVEVIPPLEAPPVTLIHDETPGVQNTNDDGIDDEDDVDPPLPPALQTAYDDLCDHEVSLQAMGTIPFGAGETVSLNAVVDGTDSGLDTGGTDSPQDVFLFNYDTNIIFGMTAEEEVVFIVYVDDATGEIWFVQCQPINHFDPTDPDEADTPEILNLLYTITGPGGATVGTIEIQIQDDGPTLEDAFFYGGNVDEDDLDTPLSEGTDEDGAGDGPAVTAVGSLAGTVNFGFDGPGGFALGDDVSALDAQNLFSKGDALSYSVSGDTLTATADGRTVFTLELQANGSWTFTLFDQLDHAPGDGENTLDIDFSSLIFAYDADEDSINLPNSVIVTVRDDVPELADGGEGGIVEEEHLSGGNEDTDPGADGDNGGNLNVTTTVASGSLASLITIGADEPATFSFISDTSSLDSQGLSSGGITLEYGFTAGGLLVGAAGTFDPTDDANWIFTLELQGNGDWEFTLLGKLDHHDIDLADDVEGLLPIDFSAMVEVTDFDEDPIVLEAETFIVQVIDDIPIANDDDDDAEVGGPAVSGNVITGVDSGDNGGAGPDDDGEADSPGADGLGVIRSITHAGVTYTLSFDGTSVDNDGGLTEGIDYTFDGATLTIDTAEGGSFAIDLVGSEIGDYTYTPPATGALSGSSEQFVYALEDGDGDADPATLTISLDDAPTAENSSIIVDEDGLPNGIGDSADGDDVVPNDDGDNDESTSSGALVYDAGTNGFKSLSFNPANGDPVLISGTLTQVTSGGVGLVWFSVSDTVIEARVSDINGDAVLRITLSNVTATGADYDVELLGPLDHPVVGAEDNILIDIGYTVTDNDDDTASAVLTVNVDDDMPVISVDGGEGSVSALSLNLDETIDPDGNDDPTDGADYYNGAETESNGGPGNGDLDDTGQPAADGVNAIGSLTTTAGTLAALFSVSKDAGADGEKSQSFTFALVLSAEGLETTLSVTPHADGGNPDLDYGDLKIYLFTAPNGTIEGRVGGADGPLALRITLNDPDDIVLGDETLTVDQYLAIDHGEDDNLYDTELPLYLVSGTLSVELSSALTDGDDDEDSDSHSVTLVDGNTTFVSFDDAGPLINSIQDAILANQAGNVVHGTYDADFGTDGLDFLSLAFGSDADPLYDFGTPQDLGDGLFQVDATHTGDSNKNFSFFFETTSSPVSEGGDGSAVFHAWFDEEMTQEFFILTVNADGTYTFELIDNSIITQTTIDFTDKQQVSAGNFDQLVLDGVTVDSLDKFGNDQNVNTSNNGLAAGTNQNTEKGETIIFTFDDEQKIVSFDVQKGTGGTNVYTLTLFFYDGLGGLLGTEVVTFDLGGGGDFETITILQGTDDLDPTDTTVFVDFDFKELHVEHTDNDGNGAYNLNNLSFGTKTSIDDITFQFKLSATDGDGDVYTLDDELTVSLQDGAVEEGIVLDAATLADGDDGVAIAGGTGDDTLLGGAGDDILEDGVGNDIILGRDGADTIILENDGDTDVIVYQLISEAGDTIEGFDSAAPVVDGVGGDVIDLSDLLDTGTFAGTTLADATGGGYVELFESGGDVEVRVDLDGGANSFTTIVTVNGVNVADLNDNIVVD